MTLCFVVIITIFCKLISSQQTCDNTTFPLIQNTQAIGLAAANAKSFDECEQQCCQSSSCTVFQWCADVSSQTCTPKNSCFIGKSYNFQNGQTGWQGRSKEPPAPQFGFTNTHGNNMVLQREPNRAQVYGLSPNVNEMVKITLYDSKNNQIESVTAKVDANYTWRAQLPPQPPSINGEEYKIVAQSTANTSAKAELTNILFGDVYICSGQSNMQFTVDQAFNVTQSLEEANNYPLIRLLSVSQTSSSKPLYEVISLKQEWSVANNVSVGGGNWTYFSAMCWFTFKNVFDEIKVPLGLIGTNYGGTPVRDWMSADAKANCPNETIIPPSNTRKDITKYSEQQYDFTDLSISASPNGGLWNAMIYPFLPMAIKGAIWYQGESDCNDQFGSIYSCAFPAMINDWRAKWNLNSDTFGNFPFGFVHLSTWGDGANNTCTANSTCEAVAIVRHGQTANYGYVPNEKMPNTYLATAIDLGDPKSPFGDIHPRYKQQVARRLSNAALNVIYGESSRYISGPIADKVSMDSTTITVNFRNVNEMGLMLNRRIGFEVYDSSKSEWVYVVANGDNVALNGLFDVTINYANSKIVKPTMIRYNWYQAPCIPAEGIYGCSIYDKQEMLPALPFELTISS